MREIPLTTVKAAGPPSRAALQRQLANLSLPPRTAALLGDARKKGPAPLSAGLSRGPAHSYEAATTAEIGIALRALVRHLASGDIDPACYRRAVGRLVGLGPGLTPTGDDLLVALVATSRLWSSGGGSNRGSNGGSGGLLPRAAAGALAAAIAALPPQLTTDVAHHLLTESAAGRFPEPLAALVGALGDPHVDRQTLASLVDRLVSTGAHSGADWLAGVVALARACAGERV